MPRPMPSRNSPAPPTPRRGPLCRDCAKLIHQVGIRRVVYTHPYKDDSGIDFLNQAGVEIVRYPEDAD